jgi:hypothetical protein
MRIGQFGVELASDEEDVAVSEDDALPCPAGAWMMMVRVVVAVRPDWSVATY